MIAWSKEQFNLTCRWIGNFPPLTEIGLVTGCVIRQIRKQDNYRKPLLKCRELPVRCPAPTDTFYDTTAIPKAQGTSWKKDWNDYMTQRTEKSAKRLSSRYDSEATPMNSQQNGCPNKTWTMTTSVNMPVCKGRISWGPTADGEL